jgi:pyruvate dehydrogenase E2 component (dihydrolipoamide acetyltransferase)
MAHKVIMPKQGLLMTEGTIIKWLKNEGESVEAGEPLFEMETDKLTITINANESGTLLKIIRGEGETVPITETIAIIGEQGEDISALIAEATAQAQEEAGEEPAGEEPVAAAEIPSVDSKGADAGRIFITPRAKTVAQEKGIDYKAIKGTGPDGLIIEKDVLDYARRPRR